MPKVILWILVSLFSIIASSQNTISIKGKIIDKQSNLPLESATVYLTSKKDSTVIDYTISGRKGDFQFQTRKKSEAVFLKVSFLGYQNYQVEMPEIDSDKELGNIFLTELDTSLDEVVLKSEAPPIRIKNDTLEFDAASFKVGADANVEKLLRQLPGVEISPEGKITVNGKEVNQILVNGKPFFGKDGKIATQNLPAEIIEKIQVVDTKTKEEELSGDAASSEEKTINLTIQEEKNKGFFGKVMGGYGTDDRYESSLLFNWFKGEQKISVLASANNINSVGFSMNEIFDNMGGGRSSSVYYSDDGSFGINGMTFGGNNGITTSNLIGLNYVDKWLKKIDMSSNYFFTNAETENVNRTSSTNLLPTGKTFTDADATSNRVSNNHNVSLNFEVEIDTTMSIYVSPKFAKSLSKDKYKSRQETTDEANALLNESTSDTYTDTDKLSFENNIYFNKSFQKKNRGLSFSFDNEYNKSDVNANINSATLFYQSADPNDIRNQNQFSSNQFDKIGTELRYTEPLGDSLKMQASTEVLHYKSNNTRNTFDYNSTTDEYDDFNAFQSNEINSSVLKINPLLGISLQKKNLRARVSAGPQFVTFKNESDYLATTTTLDENYVFPTVESNLHYTISKKKSIYANYNYSVDLPLANQILPVLDLSNPLNTIVGNADLNPTKEHSVYLNYNNYDWQARSGIFFYGGMSIFNDQIVSSTVYDDDFKAATTYQNVDSGVRSYFGATYSKSFKKEKRTFRYSFGIDSGYNFNQGLTNAELYEAKAWRLEPKVSLNWSIEELITVAPSYRYTYNTTDYANYVIDNANNFMHIFKIELTNYWPKNFVFGNDFGYTYNSNIADGFQKDFYLWNTSLGYNFYNKKLLAKVKVYDVLNQNVGVRRTITPTAITDVENTVLQQYMMFSLTYSLDKFGGKKDAGGGMIILD